MPIDMDKGESWRVFRIMAEFVEGFEELEPIKRAVTASKQARGAILFANLRRQLQFFIF